MFKHDGLGYRCEHVDDLDVSSLFFYGFVDMRRRFVGFWFVVYIAIHIWNSIVQVLLGRIVYIVCEVWVDDDGSTIVEWME